jgi:hypothetical protein
MTGMEDETGEALATPAPTTGELLRDNLRRRGRGPASSGV